MLVVLAAVLLVAACAVDPLVQTTTGPVVGAADGMASYWKGGRCPKHHDTGNCLLLRCMDC